MFNEFLEISDLAFVLREGALQFHKAPAVLYF
ncbi:hypothetical protein DFQ00_106348 [Paenibacillus barcinonensis]|uniref:Uncharacterized protein n=1 Tax=Paenibacillus barcinonensis TaxID=198119 RepID=A0A2V4WNS7_PAEBA|nr:hypothetical protein DFQ00_106348 [Paenibacillus barcinonensis]